eukprot:15510_2
MSFAMADNIMTPKTAMFATANIRKKMRIDPVVNPSVTFFAIRNQKVKSAVNVVNRNARGSRKSKCFSASSKPLSVSSFSES